MVVLTRVFEAFEKIRTSNQNTLLAPFFFPVQTQAYTEFSRLSAGINQLNPQYKSVAKLSEEDDPSYYAKMAADITLLDPTGMLRTWWISYARQIDVFFTEMIDGKMRYKHLLDKLFPHQRDNEKFYEQAWPTFRNGYNNYFAQFLIRDYIQHSLTGNPVVVQEGEDVIRTKFFIDFFKNLAGDSYIVHDNLIPSQDTTIQQNSETENMMATLFDIYQTRPAPKKNADSIEVLKKDIGNFFDFLYEDVNDRFRIQRVIDIVFPRAAHIRLYEHYNKHEIDFRKELLKAYVEKKLLPSLLGHKDYEQIKENLLKYIDNIERKFQNNWVFHKGIFHRHLKNELRKMYKDSLEENDDLRRENNHYKSVDTAGELVLTEANKYFKQPRPHSAGETGICKQQLLIS